SDYGTVPTAGSFHHIAATLRQADATHVEIKTYIDGQWVKSATVVGNLKNSTNSSPVTIGGELGAGGVASYFKGIIDEPSIYGRALSTNEIQAIYTIGAGGK